MNLYSFVKTLLCAIIMSTVTQTYADVAAGPFPVKGETNKYKDYAVTEDLKCTANGTIISCSLKYKPFKNKQQIGTLNVAPFDVGPCPVKELSYHSSTGNLSCFMNSNCEMRCNPTYQLGLGEDRNGCPTNCSGYEKIIHYDN